MIQNLTDYFSAFQPQSQEQFTIFVVVAMIFSALSIFLGYKLTKLWSTIIGAAVGFIAGYIIGNTIWGNSGAAFIAGLVLAVILGAIAFFIYKAGVFLLCGFSTFGFAYSALSGFVGIPVVTLIISIVIGIIAGIVDYCYNGNKRKLQLCKVALLAFSGNCCYSGFTCYHSNGKIPRSFVADNACRRSSVDNRNYRSVCIDKKERKKSLI